MNKKLLTVCFFVLIVAAAGFARQQAAPPAKPVDVSGAWEMTMQGPQGDMVQTVTFTQDKTLVKVVMETPMGEAKGEGSVEGNEVKWSITVSTPNGDFTVGFKGKVDGDKITGEMDLGDMGTSSFWGQKKK